MPTIYEAGAILPPRIQSLVETFNQRHHEWINNIEADSLDSQHDQMTIYGPFGGPIRRAQEQLKEIQARVRSQFQSGVGEKELIRVIESGDLLIVVLLETSQVMFEGRSEPHDWSLRVTEVYTAANGRWLRLHRHADPLVKSRPLAETLALLE